MKMKQQLSENERQEQLDIVLRLNELTKKGKLKWEKEPVSGGYPPASREAYTTQRDGYTIRVETVPRGVSRGAGVLGWVAGSGGYRIQIQESGQHSPKEQDTSKDSYVVPHMPAIDDLVVTIKRTRNEPTGVENKREHLRSLRKSLGIDS